MISFDKLTNPFLYWPGWAVKDACMVMHRGIYHVFCSAFFQEGDDEISHLAEFISCDLVHWQLTRVRKGFASPDIFVLCNEYILVYNTWGDVPGRLNQLLYARTADFENWTWDMPLAFETTGRMRAIDASVTKRNGLFFLCWKECQKLAFAYSDTLEASRWTRVNTDVDGWYENCQFISLNDKPAMLATGKAHCPYLLTASGRSGEASQLGCWRGLAMALPPEQHFNTFERANAASLFKEDGWNYLIYAGTTECESHAQRGDCTLGIARSRTMADWIAAKESVV